MLKKRLLLIDTSSASFDADVLQAVASVLVFYWADWNGPSKTVRPVLDDIALEYQDELTVASLNIDDNSETPAKYSVRGIPTLMLFKNGIAVGTKTGALSKSQLKSFLDGYL